MGFLSKIRKGMKKQVAQMPRRRGGFLRGMPMMKPSMGDMRFRGRLPQKNTAFSEAVRRLKQQQGMRPQPIPRAERMPSFNPTIFGQPIGDMDFSQLPKISPEDMMNLQVPTDMPMTQDLPEVAPIGMMPQMRMGGMQDMQPRMMMAEGDVAMSEDNRMAEANRNIAKDLPLTAYILRQSKPEQSEFVKNLIGVAGITVGSFESIPMFIERLIKTGSLNAPQVEEIAAKSQEIMNGMPQLAGGGDFPDLTGDGKVTQADILKGRGVQLKAEGGEMMTQENEIDAMLSGMDSEEAGAMEDLEQMAPEMEMIDQLVTMVVQMIQQGASEEEVIMFLREQGLDDEDIGTVLQLVAEMAEAEAMPQDGIDAELAQLS